VVGNEGTRFASFGPFGIEHEVVSDELAFAVEELRDPHPHLAAAFAAAFPFPSDVLQDNCLAFYRNSCAAEVT